MAARWTIRQALMDDAEAISRLIVQTVRETNSKDYSPAVIAEVITSFAPDRVADRMSMRQVFVAVEDGAVIGTGSLDGASVRSLFVLPAWQGSGVGRALMSHVEQFARTQGLSRLEVPASITAESFYRSIGYAAIRDEYYGEERTIIMEKPL